MSHSHKGELYESIRCPTCNIPAGYKGQQYEIRYRDDKDQIKVFGWVNRKPEQLLRIAKQAPWVKSAWIVNLFSK